jgi:protease-4
MKSFFKYTLATIVGIIIVNLIGFMIMIGVISAIVATSEKDVSIKENSVLLLKLEAEIVDRAPNDPFSELEIPGFPGSKKIGLGDIISAIEKAKHEENIKGIYLKITDVPAGYAAMQEIRKALVDFGEDTDKFIYAYSEVYTQKAYYLASAADKVFITPEGMLNFAGMASQHSFYKNALEKLGIEMQVIRHGKFKAAVEPFMLDHMSDENRRQVEVYVGSIWESMLKDISASRNIQIGDLNAFADMNLTFKPVDELYELGMVDSIVYEDQMLDILREKTGTKPKKEINAHTVANMKNVPAKREGKGLARDKIAVVYAAGEINMGGMPAFGNEFISGPEIAKEIRLARQDTTIKAIVFRVNSPGGSALASELIWREVKLAAAEKPVVVSMGNLAASGGYYIACAADTIVASPTTITGSIGVFGTVPNTQELFEDKLGINTEVVKTNKLSDFPSINRRLTVQERDIMQNMVETVYSTFVNHVAEGRGMTYEQVDLIGQGRVWTGKNALELGLVDVLGDLNDAVAIAKEMAGLDHYRIVPLPQLKDPFEEIMKGFSTQMRVRAIERELGDAAKHYFALENIKNNSGIMARMPYGIDLE